MNILQRLLTATIPLTRYFVGVVGFCLVVATSNTFAQALSDYTSIPLVGSESVTPPMVMLLVSKEHQLWRKAYDDYSDLNGDDVLDTTYNNAIPYAGYFNSHWCYEYVTDEEAPVNDRFRPLEHTEDYTCSGAWSGNFMNWLTMTRMDVLRKELYGGYRLRDGSLRDANGDFGDRTSISTAVPETVLQRALIPSDAHAFVKVFRNNRTYNIKQFTPIDDDVVNRAYSFCNVTHPTGSVSEWPLANGNISGLVNVADNVYRPRLKVAAGEFVTWSGTAKHQCLYQEETVGIADNERAEALKYIPAIPDPIPTGLQDYEFSVRVEACVSGFDAVDKTRCRDYGSGASLVSKPFGILQERGESGEFNFGLITGSYSRKTAGGVLRKNVTLLNEAGNPEVDTITGRFTNNSGIIGTIDSFRIRGWRYSSNPSNGYDDCLSHNITTTTFLDNDTQCRDWGNPLSEMYLEALRYFAGANATTAFNVNDSALLGGLDDVPVWQDPLASAPCADCAIVVLSAGQNTFDSDNLAAALPDAGIGLTVDLLNQYTGDIGRYEQESPQSILRAEIGNVAGTVAANGLANECSVKDIADLADARGICPDAPSMQGGYHIAGAAYYARTEGIVISGGDDEVRKTLGTFAVRLAESIPTIDVFTRGGQSIGIVPTCRSADVGIVGDDLAANAAGWQQCSLVDMRVAELRRQGGNVDGPVVYGRFILSWEDSPWGSDSDNDAYSVIEFCTSSSPASDCEIADSDTIRPRIGYSLDSNPTYGNGRTLATAYANHRRRPSWSAGSTIGNNEVQVRMSVLGATAGNPMMFGYVVNGVVDSAVSQVDNILRHGAYNFLSSSLVAGNNTGFVLWSNGFSSYTPFGSRGQRLKDPLWYTAKYGNFTELGAEPDRPDLDLEWVTPGTEDTPLGYFSLRNPAALGPAFQTILRNIQRRVGAGGAAAIATESGSGAGLFVQSYFLPNSSDADGNSVNWIGHLNGFFQDDQGRVREDTNANGRLDLNEDRILSFAFDEREQDTLVFADHPGAGNPARITYSLTDGGFTPVWSAHDVMNDLENVVDQRGYESSELRRYIFTAVDGNGDGIVAGNILDDRDSGEPQTGTTDRMLAFTAGHGEAFQELLDLPQADDLAANALINFIRGDESCGSHHSEQDAGCPTVFRSRTLGNETFRLGDFINSSAVVVGDPSYSSLIDGYTSRRRVVYIGGNDGLLHAFNAGFPAEEGVGYTRGRGENSTAGLPLGAELWAYAPYNLLPHLKWLSQTDYSHADYVDGAINTFDVKVSLSAGAEPVWRTVLVAGMRFGGGDYTIDLEGSDPITTRSAYIVMDISNPEVKPTLLAELSHRNLGYTLAKPVVVSGDEGNSYLIFGSGPRGVIASTEGPQATQAARLFSVSLSGLFRGQFDAADDITEVVVNENENGFIGGLAVADWDGDSEDDAVYFGTVTGTAENAGGRLMRGVLTFSAESLTIDSSRLYDGNYPFTAAPSVTRVGNEYWVFAGSGRFLVAADNLSSQQQIFLGIKEPVDAETRSPRLSGVVSDGGLVDTTGVSVFQDGRIFADVQGTSPVDIIPSGSPNTPLPSPFPLTTYSNVRSLIEYFDGWRYRFRLPTDPNNQSTASRANQLKMVVSAAFAGDNLLIPIYRSSNDICLIEGDNWLDSRNLRVGLPSPYAPLGLDPDNRIRPAGSAEDIAASVLRVLSGINVGKGLPFVPSTVVRPSNINHTVNSCDEYVLALSGSRANIDSVSVACEPLEPGRKGWREIPITW